MVGRPKLDDVRPDLCPLFAMSVHTGLRWSEQRRLAWRDADFLTGLLTVRQSKSGYARQVPMNSVVRSELMDLAYTWHCNRHTLASRLVMAGVDTRTVQTLGGCSAAPTWHRTIFERPLNGWCLPPRRGRLALPHFEKTSSPARPRRLVYRKSLLRP